ncbi:uncharacterized protein V1516DRAFT_687300 [Lipomyces oligophaga]|uniref:uncharacterized protein n=1 Tax=Lipomyces oligophaga TaxID=45792 RepID=UPI0034CE44BA
MSNSPFYVYSLPSALLSTLTPIEAQNFTPTNSLSLDSSSSLNPATDPLAFSVLPTEDVKCGTCGYLASSQQEQRDHYRSDYHRFNVKRKVVGLDAVDLPTFEQMLDEYEGSISGSDSSESDNENENDDDRISGLLKQTYLGSIAEDEEFTPLQRKSPYFFYKSTMLPPEDVFAIYSTLFPAAGAGQALALIKDQQIEADLGRSRSGAHIFVPPVDGPVSVVLMLGGGHFAGAVVSHAMNPLNKSDPVVFLQHKTFHRYTTRRKQGGSQSANDNAKGKAHSAGSSIRRYNEAALSTEIRELLADWKPYLERASHIFVRANGKANRAILTGYEGSVISAHDHRIKGIPFSTRRATGHEVKRVWLELTRPKVVKLDTIITPEPPAASMKSKPKPKVSLESASGPEVVEISPEELHTSQLVAMIRKSRIKPLTNYLTTHGILSDFRFVPESQYYHTPTMLHLAASLSLPKMVFLLLSPPISANPELTNGDGRTPWDLAGDRATRDEFRVAKSEWPTKWDWSQAHVASAIDRAGIASRDAKEAAERAADRAEAVRQAEEEARATRTHSTNTNPGKKLASSVATRISTEKQLLTGLTPEARLKIERERRARAVEARMNALKR